MPFMRFFKPKWQHPNPEVRRLAVEAMSSEDAEVLTQIALRDETAEVRKVALSRIDDLKFLHRVMGDEAESEVREFARKRLGKLLAGIETKRQPLELRRDFLRQHPDSRLVEFVALQGTEPELRIAAQEMVDGQTILGEVAIKDPVIANRLAALERISDSKVLEKVVRKTRGHDKQINRLSRAKLDEMAQERERVQRLRGDCEMICERLEQMGQGGDWDKEIAEFEGLETRWQCLEGEAEEAYWTRHAAARDTFMRASAAFREARAAQEKEWSVARGAKQTILTELERRCDELLGLESLSEETEAEYRSELDKWHHAWSEIADLPDPLTRPLNETYAQNCASMDKRLVLLNAQRKTEAALQRLIDRAQELLDGKKPLTENQVKSLERQREKIKVTSRNALTEGYDDLHKQIQSRLLQQAEKRKKEFEKLPGQLEKLEALLNDKVMKEAIPMHDRVQSGLGQLQELGMPQEKLRPFYKRLQRITPQVRELQSWRTWGADEARERLCEEMEALIGSEQKAVDLAAKIRHLRAEWNHLRSDGGATGKTLRKRFDKAADEAYKPCETFFKQQSEQRGSNLEKKHELLQQLESYLETVEWSHMDWKAAVKFHRQISNDWHRTGPVDRREAKAVNSRYEKAIGVINEHLELEHQRNLAQRKGLIEKVKALIELEDIGKAIEECKQLQTQWHTTVPGKRKLENEIWQTFREACDAVFARRKQQQDERHVEEQQNKIRKQAICDGIEQLSQAGITELDTAERKLHKLLDEWKEIGFVAKRDIAPLDERLEKAQKLFYRHREELLEQEEQAQLRLLREKAAICGELERWLEQPEAAIELTSLEQNWSQLSALTDQATNASIQERYVKVVDALKDETQEKRAGLMQELEANLEVRKELCLRMEILCGVTSPPEYQQARMEYQANRLAEAMGQGEEDPVGKTAELEHSWCLTGCAPASEEARLQQRFDKARSATADAEKSV